MCPAGQTLEEGRRIYQPKHCENNNKDEDNSPKTLNDKNHQALSQKFRQLKIHKLMRMTYNDISEFFGLVPGTWQQSKCLVKEKGVTSPKYTAIIKRRPDKWNLKWPAPLSLGCQVIVNICIINCFHIYIHSPLTKSKNKHSKERKKMQTSVNHSLKNKLYK